MPYLNLTVTSMMTKEMCCSRGVNDNFMPIIFQNVEWMMFGPISESMQAAFPRWDATTVTLTVNCGIIAYIVAFIPVCWAVQRYGLRACLLITFGLTTAGSAFRCITSTTPAFTMWVIG